MEPGVPYVVCSVPVTSPTPTDWTWKMCGEQVPIYLPSDLMTVKCPRGHVFLAARDDIREDA